MIMRGEEIKVGIAKLLHHGHLGRAELDESPVVVEGGGLLGLLEGAGCSVVESRTAELTEEEGKQYGARHRMALASKHLSEIVAGQIGQGAFPIGLLANCNGLMGMLAGHQRSGPGWRPLKVGLVWMDAHGDFNTPETSLSGMLGGMPVAVSTGLCLEEDLRAGPTTAAQVRHDGGCEGHRPPGAGAHRQARHSPDKR